QVGAGQQGGELLLGAFAPTQQDEHRQVHGLSRVEGVVRRQDRLDDQKFCVPVHGSSTAAQNVGGLFVGPVVQNPLQQVEVTDCRYFTEEVPAHHRTPIGKALLPDPFPCKVCGPGGVEDDSVGLGFVVQDRAQQSPRTTSDVDDPGGFREIVG